MDDLRPIRCPHAPPCGGCALLARPIAEQLAWKRDRTARALARYPALRDVAVRPCVPAPSPVGYRTRVKFAVRRTPGAPRAAIGLFLPGTHDVVDLPECRVAHPGLLPILEALRDLLGQGTLPVAHLDLRWSRTDGRAHVTFVVHGFADRAEADRLAGALMARRAEVAGVGLRSAAGDVPTPRAIGGTTAPLRGKTHLTETTGEARFRLSPGAFFQADPGAAERLHGVVRDWILDPDAGPPAHLLDLYAGVGAFAITLAGAVPRTTAVESVSTAAEDAEASASLSGVRIEVARAPVERFLAERSGARFDRIVLDPPRRGVPASALRGVARAGPVRAAMVSCDPDTLARDLDVLAALGLSARAVVPVDLFSLTDEVEAVALLAPSSGSFRPALPWTGSDAVAAEKPAALPTHPQGEGGASLRELVRRATGRADLQPAHRLDAGTSGPVLFARGEMLRHLGRAFETGTVEKEYLALVRGVPRRSGRIGDRGGGRNRADAERPVSTRYRLESVIGGYGLVRVRPETGRRHQIRRHLASIGHPVLGDERYGDRRANRFLAEVCALARPFLHLATLGFAEPDGRRVRIASPLPPELETVLERLRALREGRR